MHLLQRLPLVKLLMVTRNCEAPWEINSAIVIKMDQLPFNKIIVDNRHASVGTSTNFEITLPETMSLPHNAACYVTDVVISNTMPTLGTAAGTVYHSFYFIERIGSLTALNRVYLDKTKMYEGNQLAAEIQTKMNAGSLGGTGGI